MKRGIRKIVGGRQHAVGRQPIALVSNQADCSGYKSLGEENLPAANCIRPAETERGIALVSVLLILSLLLMLGVAVTFTTLSDKAITSNFQNVTSGFYAAEAGINTLHRLIRSEKFVTSSLLSDVLS